ncbi:ATP-binding protein [Macrococcus brunensis]|uniref:ATP-binding protein n=1 Tax=Macrococcus brunensis TaxID=198483 RepID=UPI001EF0FF7F|nr:ATP-binding protein [Macrococcus brunensis]ULG72670.1 ATP-binding protein [Macrococcus brunensis]
MKHLKRYIFVNLLITLTLSIFSYFFILQHEKDIEQSSIDRSLSIHEQQIATFIDDAISTVQTIATVMEVAPKTEALQTAISSSRSKDGSYKSISIVDKDGRVMISSNQNLIGQLEHSYAFYEQHKDPHQISINFSTEEFNGVDDIYISKFMTYKGEPVVIVAEMNINTLMTSIDAVQRAKSVELTDLNNNMIFKSKMLNENGISNSKTLQNVDWRLKIISNRNLALDALRTTAILFLLLTLVVATIQLFNNVYERQKEKLRLIEEINAQKKELIGMLAANTAHEIKNPLTSVRGFVELLELKYDRQGENPHFAIIKTEIDRITDIVGQFLLLGRPTEENDQPTEVVKVVKDTLNFMKYDFDVHQMRLISSYQEPELYTLMAADQLKQVLINLLQNAKEAIPDGRSGVIEIKVQLQDMIIITITDNGIGMSESAIKRLYEPFYTTKITGTGLGLPVTRNMIELAGGTIDAQSTVDVGTTFIIRLPIIQS